MFIAIINISFIAAIITACSSVFREKILKWPGMVAVVVLWFLTESENDILRYLSGKFLGGRTTDEVIRPYYILLWVCAAVSLFAAFMLIKASIKTDFAREKSIDIITAMLIIFIVIINFFCAIQLITKFYDSSYIYSTPVARSVLIMWASLFIRRYMAAKKA